MSSSDRLSVLTAEYLRASSRYSAQHPDIIRLSREIRVLAGQLGTGGRADELLSELIRLQEQLRQTQQRYSADHPEVQRLQRAVSAVQKGIRSDVVAGASGDTEAAPPDNPRYVALRTQLEADESNLQAELTRLEELQARLDIYENRLFQTPVVERDFNVINRKYENALAQYRELRDKQQQAELAKELESGESGEKFLLTGAAFLPKLPDSPNRIAIILLGAFFASATAIASVAAAEYLDRTVRNSRMIARTLGAPPLAVIPQMHNPQMRKAFRRGRASGG